MIEVRKITTILMKSKHKLVVRSIEIQEKEKNVMF